MDANSPVSANYVSFMSIDEFLLYTCDLSLAVLSGLVFALFNLSIGQYLSVSVAHNGNPEHFALIQCIVHFMTAGCAAFLLPFLHHVSINTDIKREGSAKLRLSTVYRRTLGIFVRDLVFLLASVGIAFSRSWPLTVPILLVPILVTAWTTLLEKQKPALVRGLFLAGPMGLFFLTLSLGGLYGTYLVDLDVLNRPGDIFTIVAGIGSSAVQFAKARAQFHPLTERHNAPQLYVHDENLDKPEYEKNPIEEYASSSNVGATNGAQKQTKEREQRPKHLLQVLSIWTRVQLRLLKRWPLLCAGGLLGCVAHSLGYPVFTRLTGLFFSVFEEHMGAQQQHSPLLAHVQWICAAYATMALVVFVGVTTWNSVFGQMGTKLRAELQQTGEQSAKVDWAQIEMAPLLIAEFLYGVLCILFAIASCLQNNRPMGVLAAGVFCLQVLFQSVACTHLKSKYGKAIGFASTNGMQQFSQALAYTGGFVLVKLELVTALNVFKIIQTMHLGSMGLSSVVLLTNDFYKGSTQLRGAIQGLSGGKAVAPNAQT